MDSPTAKKKRNVKGRQSVLQLKVHGPGVRSGTLPVPDLIRICQEMQNAISRQAEAIEGRKTIHPGPIVGKIQQECTLELIGIKKGTTTLQFDVAKPQPYLLDDAPNLAAEVVAELASTIKKFSNGVSGDLYNEVAPGVLNSLYNLGELASSPRISKIDWISPRKGGHKRISAPLTKAVTNKIATQLSRPRLVAVVIEGILDMADFRPKDRKCRIDPALGTPTTCEFDEDLENAVYSLLRKPARVTGAGMLRPYGEKPDVIRIHSISPLPSLELGRAMFYASPSIQDLAAAQNVKPLKSAADLATKMPTDEDVDTMIQEIYSSRK
jgi:hypothetical protein